jgi:hypothetical protein
MIIEVSLLPLMSFLLSGLKQIEMTWLVWPENIYVVKFFKNENFYKFYLIVFDSDSEY